MAKNEATLEARIDGVLTSVFPTFRMVNVQYQKSFSIKFGHHNVVVNLKEPSVNPARAIFDVLLTVDDKNTILLELKREGLTLTDEDISQGISYARLIHPMPPLTLISNGEDNLFYNTYTKENISKTNVDLEYIQNLIDNSFQLAINDFKDAISVLLNKEPDLFSKIINQITEVKFERLLGTVNDFTKPICIDFQIERQCLKQIQTLFTDGAALIGIVGSAFTGKTNLLYQFFNKTKSEKNFLLYLDCNDHNYSIFQQLANHFTENTKVLITKDKIREWLINSLIHLPDGKFYLLLDNFNNDIPESIKSEIIELIDIFKGVNHHTLYSIDEFNYKRIAFVENRQYKTIIGDQSKLIQLDELNDEEYDITNSSIFDKYKVLIEHGGHYTPEYREPRILRHLVSLYHGGIKDGQFTKIDAVPNLNLLKAITSNKTYTKQIHDLYRKITYCFFIESELRKKDIDLSIMASGSGAITTDIFKKKFPDDFNDLIKSSIAVFREIRNGMTIIYPKIQELIAVHSISLITKMMIQEKEKSTTELCKLLLDTTISIPYCDIVANGVLLEIAKANEVELFSNLVQELLKMPPLLEKIEKGTKTLMYVEGVGHIQMNFDDDINEGGFIADFLPYVILSQLAAYPLGLVDNKEYSIYAFHLHLLYEVGSSKELLRRADVRSLNNIKALESFDLDGVGSIISGHEGVIEPFVQSIQKCFFQMPNEIEWLYEKAFEENNFNLLYRIYLALRTIINNTDPELTQRSENYVKRFNKYFDGFMAEYLSKDVKDPIEKKALYKKLLEMKIGESEESD
ncbi:hypothetical protein [Dysgonomonas sp. BGC7]|uniref:hypothetical protein n=1 Tax=Dysgonomonas sp. BGC7 TaxID=1658008 RepID=UPI0006809417|nr:hypothetical protein [Dysgonomonas sp. BGC7]MBD8388366.1 hypothetical protein [Dysgonomonas sp. BGC7]